MADFANVGRYALSVVSAADYDSLLLELRIYQRAFDLASPAWLNPKIMLDQARLELTPVKPESLHEE